jgi:hypothetical protein
VDGTKTGVVVIWPSLFDRLHVVVPVQLREMSAAKSCTSDAPNNKTCLSTRQAWEEGRVSKECGEQCSNRERPQLTIIIHVHYCNCYGTLIQEDLLCINSFSNKYVFLQTTASKLLRTRREIGT